jgi:UDP-N-acetyl-D-glucosamine dehydrogenase
MGAETSFIELAERINSGMPDYNVRLVIDAVNGTGKSICGAKVLVIGLSYKRDIDDLRESPALPICELLRNHGAMVNYHDPYIPSCLIGGQQLRSIELTAQLLQWTDCVVIVTDHSCLDKDLLVSNATLIVDTRNCLRAYTVPHIVRL